MSDLTGAHGAMGTTGLYDWGAVILSTICIILAGWYLWRVIKTYRMYHDDRAAISLGKAMGLFVISIGLTISASGLVLEASSLAVAGMTLARGALLVTLATLVLAGVRPGESERTE